MYLTFDALWGFSSKWQINEVLSLWQFGITGLALIAAVIIIKHAVSQFEYGRKKDEKARTESLSQIRYSLKCELETNLGLLRSEAFKIWYDINATEKIAVLFRPLKISTFELIAGREDLKYLSPEALNRIAEAYDQIKDFNSVLNSWFSRSVLREEPGYYSEKQITPTDLSRPTTKQLEEERKRTIEKIDEALKLL